MVKSRKVVTTTNWFENLINNLYASFFDPSSALYLPTIITQGYQDPKLGINIEPRASVALNDRTNIQSSHPMPGGCGLGFTAGNAVLAATSNVLTNLQSIAPTPDQAIDFEQEDSVLHIPLTFASLIINGNLGVSQPCKDSAPAQYTGTYTMTCTDIALVVSLTLSLGDSVSATVDKIDATIPNLSFKGDISNAPRNLGLWWSQLTSDPQAIQPFRQMLIDELSSDQTRAWIEGAINPQLASLPI